MVYEEKDDSNLGELEEEEQEEPKKEDIESFEPDEASSHIGFSLFIILIAIIAIIITSSYLLGSGLAGVVYWIIAIVILIVIFSSIKMNNQWEQAVILRLGKYNRIAKEGVFFKIPILERVIKRDLRVHTEKLEKQELLTKDNISVFIDAVLFLKVVDAKKSIIEIDNYRYAMFQYAQTAMRTHIGLSELDQLLSQRQKIAETIRADIEKHIKVWGIDITNLEIQDISLPSNMKRVMARQAEAEREKRGVIIASEGEVIASKNLQKASKILGQSKFGMKLRELTTIKDVSADGNTVIFYPTEMGIKAASSALARSRNKK